MTVQPVSVEQAAAWLEAGQAVMVDVREVDEHAAVRIEGVILAPLSRMPAALEGLDLPADRKIIMQCAKGGRSAQVCAYLQGVGRQGQAVYNLTGGIAAWQAAGLPVVGDAV
ncbi:rhodanese-like domain-containing protein [Brevundimonas sp.]|uniref:rhodanese-like domain-containing protein n=1 Tax=Brevundimonas sp. TaxID=1871086 RepID=UPI002AC919D0|nr:rhodanese-like domain-containing protein [Brevundimonas sp.]